MTQGDLFGVRGLEPKQQAVAREKREQEQQLVRVHGAIAGHILHFLEGRRMRGDRTFTMKELQASVARSHPTAPGSTDRILRLLRQDGRCSYRVVNRAASLYEVLPIEGGTAPCPK